MAVLRTTRRNLLWYLLVFVVSVTIALSLAAWTQFREGATIILFAPVIYGFMVLSGRGMVLSAVAVAILRVVVEAIQTWSGGPRWWPIVYESAFPLLLYAALGVAFHVYRLGRQRLTERLAEARSREAMIRLTDSIAHDFNNILTVIIGVADMLRRDESLTEQARNDVQQILESGQQGVALVRHMREFSKELNLDAAPCDLAEEIQHEMLMIRRLIPDSVRVDMKLGGDRIPVKVDSGQFQRALMNLCVNACHAMPDGGTLSIGVGRDPDGDLAIVEVSDSGAGIDPKQAERIFEPFYTTRQSAGGTGLGLSIVRSIVRAHGGKIACDSTPGKGTTFTVRLPILHDADRSSRADRPPSPVRSA